MNQLSWSNIDFIVNCFQVKLDPKEAPDDSKFTTPNLAGPIGWTELLDPDGPGYTGLHRATPGWTARSRTPDAAEEFLRYNQRSNQILYHCVQYNIIGICKISIVQ